MSDLRRVVDDATARLTRAGIVGARADVVRLVGHVLAVDLGEVERRVLLRGRVEPEDLATLEALLDERAARVPLQHLTGTAPFRGVDLAVGPGVFVPRPETEVVAGLAIEAARAVAHPVVVDLCTGSGAIAVALAREVPGARVHAVELSAHAHAWAQRNVADHAPAVSLVLGDALEAFDDLAGEVDVVVSNPPYVPHHMEPVDPEVRDHDPALALYGGGRDGLELPRRILARAAVLLHPGGTVVLEHAEVQSGALLDHAAADPAWSDARDVPDLTGRPRAHVATRTAAPTPASPPRVR